MILKDLANMRNYQDPLNMEWERLKFISSASDWTDEHLAYFQVIVLSNQFAKDLFAGAFILQDDTEYY